MVRHWYKLVTGDCHTGRHYRGEKRPMQTIYIHATSLDHALTNFGRMPGVPRDALPDARRLNDREEAILEQNIRDSDRVTLRTAKKTYYRFDKRSCEKPPV